MAIFNNLRRQLPDICTNRIDRIEWVHGSLPMTTFSSFSWQYSRNQSGNCLIYIVYIGRTNRIVKSQSSWHTPCDYSEMPAMMAISPILMAIFKTLRRRLPDICCIHLAAQTGLPPPPWANFSLHHCPGFMTGPMYPATRGVYLIWHFYAECPKS